MIGNTVATRISTWVCSEALCVWWLTLPTWWDYSHHGNKALRNLDLMRDFLDRVSWPGMAHSKWSCIIWEPRLNPKEKVSWTQHVSLCFLTGSACDPWPHTPAITHPTVSQREPSLPQVPLVRCLSERWDRWLRQYAICAHMILSFPRGNVESSFSESHDREFF